MPGLGKVRVRELPPPSETSPPSLSPHEAWMSTRRRRILTVAILQPHWEESPEDGCGTGKSRLGHVAGHWASAIGLIG